MSAQDRFLRSLFDAAVSTASAEIAVPPFLPEPPKGRTLVVGAGKAAALMARTVERHWPGPLSGMVATRYGHSVPTEVIRVVEAAHPVPDAAGAAAAAEMMTMAQELGADDLMIALISGGGSALLTLPAPGIDPNEKRSLNKALLLSGARIDEMNCVRKHLSAIKGGRLACAAWPAKVVTLAISDVPGDDPAVIASGPTVADSSTSAEALAVLDRYGISVSAAIRAHLASPASETPKPGDPRLANTEVHVITNAAAALDAAVLAARKAGMEPVVLGDAIEGEARIVAAEHARLALAAGRGSVLLSGGETTVTVTGQGRGGRNVEYLLALLIALDGAEGIHALACDTDGIDGSEDNAGAFARPDSLARARTLGLDPRAMLADNDAYGFFAALGDLIHTGPTRTNVNDFRAILIDR